MVLELNNGYTLEIKDEIYDRRDLGNIVASSKANKGKAGIFFLLDFLDVFYIRHSVRTTTEMQDEFKTYTDVQAFKEYLSNSKLCDIDSYNKVDETIGRLIEETFTNIKLLDSKKK